MDLEKFCTTIVLHYNKYKKYYDGNYFTYLEKFCASTFSFYIYIYINNADINNILYILPYGKLTSAVKLYILERKTTFAYL